MMRNGVLRCFGVVVAMCLSSGCPSSSDGGSTGSIAPADLEDEVIRGICEVIANCYTESDDNNGVRILTNAVGVEACTHALLDAGDIDIAELIAAIDAGRVHYDGAKARACLNRMRATCSGPSTLSAGLPECLATFEGTVAVGGSCAVDEECAGSAFCARDGDACGGTCQAKRAPGSACEQTKNCDLGAGNGAACLPSSTGSDVCVSLTITYDVAAGQPCGELNEVTADHTQRRGQCAPGLYCKSTDAGGPGTCTAPTAPGASCESGDTPCAGSNFCNGSGTGSATCRPVTVRNTAGESCDESMLIVCNSLARLRCQSGTCQVIGDGSLGATCADFAQCNEGLYCSGSVGGSGTRTCAAKKATGERCVSDQECLTNRCVSGEGVPSVCTAACPTT